MEGAVKEDKYMQGQVTKATHTSVTVHYHTEISESEWEQKRATMPSRTQKVFIGHRGGYDNILDEQRRKVTMPVSNDIKRREQMRALRPGNTVYIHFVGEGVATSITEQPKLSGRPLGKIHPDKPIKKKRLNPYFIPPKKPLGTRSPFS